MFRAFARIPSVPGTPSSAPYGADNLFRLHPSDIVAALELAWDRRLERSAPFAPGHPFRRSDLNRFEDSWFGRAAVNSPVPSLPRLAPAGPRPLQPDLTPIVLTITNAGKSVVLHDHLIYAYMIDNTNIKNICKRVVHEFLHGEKLGPPSPDTQHWLRTTEQLFFRDPPPLFVSSVHSDIRQDPEATVRNAYLRLLGMDLNRGGPDNKPYSYVRAEAANKEFAATFEELLREVWVGIINAGNSSGAKATDDAKLLDLVKKIKDMMVARRINGNLSREEFTFVSMMSWFHLTFESNSPLVKDLRADASSAEQRLFKVAQLVGLPAHGLSGSYFDIADSISRILILFESDFFTQFPAFIVGLYTPGTVLEQAMRTIITHWSIIAGRDIKSGKVTSADMPRQPVGA